MRSEPRSIRPTIESKQTSKVEEPVMPVDASEPKADDSPDEGKEEETQGAMSLKKGIMERYV